MDLEDAEAGDWKGAASVREELEAKQEMVKYNSPRKMNEDAENIEYITKMTKLI